MNLSHSDQINELAAALAKAQGAMRGALKDASNPFFKSHYADLASVWEACREPLTAHGLSVVQSPNTEGATVRLETVLLHSSGQWMRGEVSATAKDEGPQAVGSTVTYLRRYALQSFAGVAPEDDDAEAGEGRTANQPTTRTPTTQAAKPVHKANGVDGVFVASTKVAKEGKSAKGPWTLYAVKFNDGREATTFSKLIYDAAQLAFKAQKPVDPTIDGKNLVALEPVYQQHDDMDEPPPVDSDGDGMPF